MVVSLRHEVVAAAAALERVDSGRGKIRWWYCCGTE